MSKFKKEDAANYAKQRRSLTVLEAATLLTGLDPSKTKFNVEVGVHLQVEPDTALHADNMQHILMSAITSGELKVIENCTEHQILMADGEYAGEDKTAKAICQMRYCVTSYLDPRPRFTTKDFAEYVIQIGLDDHLDPAYREALSDAYDVQILVSDSVLVDASAMLEIIASDPVIEHIIRGQMWLREEKENPTLHIDKSPAYRKDTALIKYFMRHIDASYMGASNKFRESLATMINYARNVKID